uniref:Uncharacterized protein n=1 Tax=Cacopsylla melanoneura TaxID=428564 RepID=A0A8D8THW1_9HEMI
MCIWASKLFIRHQFLFVYLYSYIPTLRLDPQKIACGRCGAFIELLNTILTFDWVSKYFTLRSSIVHENKSLPRSEKKHATPMVCIRSSVGITNYGSDNNKKGFETCFVHIIGILCRSFTLISNFISKYLPIVIIQVGT